MADGQRPTSRAAAGRRARWAVFTTTIALALAVSLWATRGGSDDAAPDRASTALVASPAAELPPVNTSAAKPALATPAAPSATLPAASSAAARRTPPPATDAETVEGIRVPDRAAAARAAFQSLDGTQTFRVPQPGDPEWADYVQMLSHPRFRSGLANAPGRALPYDPEWRSEVRGRREVTPIEDRLEGGTPSAQALGKAILAALIAGDRQALDALVITESEFRAIFWPEFPQSRPYVKVPVAEAWGFHRAAQAENTGDLVDALRGRPLDFVTVELVNPIDYTNFTMMRDVVVWVRDVETGARLGLGIMPTIVERHGRWKAYAFGKENRLAPSGTGR